MSKHSFDPKKFKDDLRDHVNRFKDDLDEQIHRTVHDSLNWKNETQQKCHPMVVGTALRGRGVMGAILILLGFAFFLDHMGYISVYSLCWRFWPLLLVLAGIINFICRHHRAWGVFLIVPGVLLQLNKLGIMHLGLALIWPMMLIALGLVVLWRSLNWNSKPGASPLAGGDPRTMLNEAVVFGSLERRMTSQNFQGGVVRAIFSGVELDLSEANMQANEASLAITTIFAAVEIRVPLTWQVALRGSPVFGDIEDKTRPPRVADPSNASLKTLVVTGDVIFGGLEIKN